MPPTGFKLYVDQTLILNITTPTLKREEKQATKHQIGLSELRHRNYSSWKIAQNQATNSIGISIRI